MGEPIVLFGQDDLPEEKRNLGVLGTLGGAAGGGVPAGR